MNQTIKSNISLMVFFSILLFGIMTAIAVGAMNKTEHQIIMLPFGIFFFLWGCLPFFSWKRSFEREMVMTPSGIDFQLKPGKRIFIPWAEINAVGMGANATIYMKDGRKLVIFWTGIGIPEGCEGYPVFKAHSLEVNRLKPKAWLTPIFFLGLLYVAMETGSSLSQTTRHLLMTVFAVAALYRIFRYLREYIFRS